MHSYLPGTEGEAALRTDGWLATGDLGFMADGELFVVGRRKDLIIRGGRNYYAEDLEDAAARIPGVRPGRLAAFSIGGAEQEQVILVAEARPYRAWIRRRSARRSRRPSSRRCPGAPTRSCSSIPTRSR